MTGSDGLVFVYNADGGAVNVVRDLWHRVTSPSTYPCSLCRITYGPAGMRREWHQFTDELDVPVTFLHRDEFRTTYGVGATMGIDLPVALLERNGRLVPIVSAAEFGRAESVEDLRTLVTAGLESVGP
jgi:hypothetical protein